MSAGVTRGDGCVLYRVGGDVGRFIGLLIICLSCSAGATGKKIQSVMDRLSSFCRLRQVFPDDYVNSLNSTQ